MRVVDPLPLPHSPGPALAAAAAAEEPGAVPAAGLHSAYHCAAKVQRPAAAVAVSDRLQRLDGRGRIPLAEEFRSLLLLLPPQLPQGAVQLQELAEPTLLQDVASHLGNPAKQMPAAARWSKQAEAHH
jgi:hypothetical protein